MISNHCNSGRRAVVGNCERLGKTEQLSFAHFFHDCGTVDTRVYVVDT